ncbi:endonuclease/exonuclease/phosphatase family protein [Rhizomonospora bruguierae]|uniref:endonuclease/exonuclease/phosphatase family protein n=1 Tax=Rhizomonospora bruguierae TaxID=1581705 RepID=UPI001BD14927|nr:endonuclease/exonuclease/phosphatase family protein [Micromonospora sp. NBRC 107566]
MLCWLAVAPGALWAVVRIAGLDWRPFVQLIAFTPYAAAGSVLPLALAVLLRRWRQAAVAGLALALLAFAVLPRAIADNVPAVRGPVVRVMTANALFGRADPAALVAEVRERRVDLLAMQEFTPDLAAGLDAAEIGALLPYRELHPEPGAAGSAIYSRFPLRDGAVRRQPGSGFLQASATVLVPGAPELGFESVHPCPPAGWGTLNAWRRELSAQYPATPKGGLRVLAGDFNATLDHAPLRRLIATGYRDAADAAGAGLIGTWGPYDDDPIPPVTIDHVLADKRIGVESVEVHGTPGSDHRKVLAELTLPRGDNP